MESRAVLEMDGGFFGMTVSFDQGLPSALYCVLLPYVSNIIETFYHSPCSNPWYEPMEESRGSLLKPILGT